MKKVLITGGEGFLGSYLVSYLVKKGCNVAVLDTLSGGDITSLEDVRTSFKRHGPFDTVYHLASAMPDKVASDELTWNTNVDGTVNVASEAVKHGVKSIVFTSSNVVYGIPKELPVTEATQVAPLEIYGRSKVAAEQELEKFKNKINIQIFRSPVITGVGRLGLQSILFEFISENRNVYVLGNGSNKYQFVDAMDVCVALEKASHVRGFDIYNIGGDGVMTIRDLYQNLINCAGSKSKVVSLPASLTLGVLAILDKLNISPLGVYQYSMIGRTLYMDTTKIKKKLGWLPKKTNLNSFIENYQWYIRHKEAFTEVGKGNVSNNRSLPKMKIFKLLKLLS